MIVYKLYHTRVREDGADDEKLIGIYTSEDKAKAAIPMVAAALARSLVMKGPIAVGSGFAESRSNRGRVRPVQDAARRDPEPWSKLPWDLVFGEAEPDLRITR